MAKKFKCEKCGSKNVQVSYTGHGPILYCYDCGEYIQDLNEEELSRAKKQMQVYKSKQRYPE